MQNLIETAQAIAQEIGIFPASVVVAPLRGKWGQCTSKGAVTLSPDVAALTAEQQRYVIAHELLHVRHRDHGRLFQAHLSRLVPGWRAIHQGLTMGKGRKTR